MDEKTVSLAHKVSFNNRQGGSITGIRDVISFDLNCILLETDFGMMTIKGKDLHVNRLSIEKGELEVSGTIDGIMYSEISSFSKKSESFFSKMFK